jgi:hypothetical protein
MQDHQKEEDRDDHLREPEAQAEAGLKEGKENGTHRWR